jgi:hypothetical protein
VIERKRAIYSELPGFSKEGYSLRGSAVVTIGDISVLMGDSDRAHELASELVRRWNAAEAIGAAE